MKHRILFLGPPGAGKGTQAQRLCATHDMIHLSTGDLLRAEVAAGSKLGYEVEATMNRGELITDSLVFAIVESHLRSQCGYWLLDGFPRSLAQAQSLEVLLLQLGQPIEAVVLLDLDDSMVLRRLAARGRTDDSETVIRHRLEVYHEKASPLINYYRQQGLLSTVAAQGTAEETAARIEEVIR
ncbi:adenylate kinase [cyanobiont of Ornithocercus magnificus]|nr:adenylate kinase [cyanobiont of Ornithocercus magnificus]